MDNVLMHLKNLGFTDLEAKCLQVLAVSGTQTGYEIAKGLGVSRSNVYAALQKLAEKGAVLTSHGEPTLYQCVPIEEIGERIESELQASIRYVKEHLPKQDAHRSEYYSLEGDAKVIERVRSELKKAREEVFCELSSEEAKLLKEELRVAPVQGVRVLVTPSREAGAGFHPFARKRVDSSREQAGREGRSFTILIDRKLAIVGTRGGGELTLAMLTEHPAMVELLYHHFCSSVVLQELQQDMGAKLEDKYGKNYKKITQKYIDGKVQESKRVEEPKVAKGKQGTAIEPSDGLESPSGTSDSEPSSSVTVDASRIEGLNAEMAGEGKAEQGKRSESKSEEGKSEQGKRSESKSEEGKVVQGKRSESKSDEVEVHQRKRSESKSDEGKSETGKRKKKK